MFAETYIPTWVSIQTKQRCISAITFVINSEHEHYVPDISLEEVAKRVIRAEGNCGSCHDYVRNTVKCLHQLGLRDSILEQLLTLIEYPSSYEYYKTLERISTSISLFLIFESFEVTVEKG